MRHRDIIVVGASAGGIEALQGLVRSLSPDFPAAIFVTVHFPEHGKSVLPRILTRAGRLSAVHACDGESIVPGRIYVASPNYHLLIEPERVRVVRGAKENGNRPAIDPMFRSAAVAYGPRVIGVVLTGLLDDGTAGLAAIKRTGGVAVVQDPADALFPSMPESAIQYVEVDRVLTVRDMGAALMELVAEPLQVTVGTSMRDDVMEKRLSAAKWTTEALLSEQAIELDDAMWTALRALEENADLGRQIAERHRSRGAEALARRFDAQAAAGEARAAVVRDTLVRTAESREADQDETEPRQPRRSTG